MVHNAFNSQPAPPPQCNLLRCCCCPSSLFGPAHSSFWCPRGYLLLRSALFWMCTGSLLCPQAVCYCPAPSFRCALVLFCAPRLSVTAQRPLLDVHWSSFVPPDFLLLPSFLCALVFLCPQALCCCPAPSFDCAPWLCAAAQYPHLVVPLGFVLLPSTLTWLCPLALCCCPVPSVGCAPRLPATAEHPP